MAERTPHSKRIEDLSPEEKVDAAEAKITELIQSFGREAIEAALKRQSPPLKE